MSRIYAAKLTGNRLSIRETSRKDSQGVLDANPGAIVFSADDLMAARHVALSRLLIFNYGPAGWASPEEEPCPVSEYGRSCVYRAGHNPDHPHRFE